MYRICIQYFTFVAKYVCIYFSYYEANKSTIGFITALSICHKVVFVVWIFVLFYFVLLFCCCWEHSCVVNYGNVFVNRWSQMVIFLLPLTSQCHWTRRADLLLELTATWTRCKLHSLDLWAALLSAYWLFNWCLTS